MKNETRFESDLKLIKNITPVAVQECNLDIATKTFDYSLEG